MQKNNILYIGKNTDNVLTDIWHLNTNYTVIQCNDLNNKQFQDYIKKLKNPNITYITAEKLQEKHSINDVVAFCRKFNYTPIIVSRSNKDPEHICYLALEDMLKKTIEYRLNDENIEYEEFLDICSEYVKGRRHDDNTIQTSGGRKRVSSE